MVAVGDTQADQNQGSAAETGGVLGRDDMMPLLLTACPSSRGRWEAYVADPLYDPGLVYVHLADFAHHLLELLASGRLAELPAVFAAVERFFLEGEEYVREAAPVGLLEGLWFSGGNTNQRPQRLAEFLGPEAREAWTEAAGFWWDLGDLADLSPNVRNWLPGFAPVPRVED
jgi:hypothetical protein